MTIRMLQAWNGYPQQAIVSTLSGAEETRLVGLGLATLDLDGPAENLVPVMGSYNPVTGGSTLSAPTSTLKLPPGETDLSNGAGGNAWRTNTYFTRMCNSKGGDQSGTRVLTTRHNFMQSAKVLRRVSRFRLWFSSGTAGTNTDFTLNGTVEGPAKNLPASARIIPFKFNGQASILVPAGGSSVFCTDWIPWPADVGDTLYIKGNCYNGGSAFTMPSFQGPNDGTDSTTGTWDSGLDNYASDCTGIARGTAPWASSNYLSGMFRCLMLETDCAEAVRAPTVDIWGTSIAFGGTPGSMSYLNRLLVQKNVPFQNYAIAGSNQDQIPYEAFSRISIARGDIAICEHGLNSASTARLAALWSYLRGLGYRKIIQILTPNATDGANTITQDKSGMRTFINAAKGIGDGPDVIWDAFSILQTPGGQWQNIAWTQDGIHPSLIGDGIAYAGGLAAGWLADLD